MIGKMTRGPSDSWDICSVMGSRRKNDDYGLFEADIGGCLADGIGSFPMGDAVARYACHIALDSMIAGFDTRDSLICAQEHVADFVRATGSPNSGAALTVLKTTGDDFEVSWLGDVACLLSRKDSAQLEVLTAPHRARSSLTRYVGKTVYEPSTVKFSASCGDRIILCTDGVWNELSQLDIQQALDEAETPREACANLVLCKQTKDNATALAHFI